MKLRKKLYSILLSASLIASGLSGMGMSHKLEVKAANDLDVFDDLNQKSMTRVMGAGWNLGNQLEASVNGVPAENCWNNGIITEDLIKKVKEAGFTSIRVPVSYLSKIGSAPGYKVDSAWLNRVQEVVDMCIRNNLFVIINMHGDGYTTVNGGWLLCASNNQTEIKAKYKAVWNQIATKFKNYDEHLIFESMNEEFNGTWNTPDRTAYSNLNAYNQIFLDTVRLSGGNNDKRWLLIPGWNTDINYTVGNYGFQMPKDTYCTASGKRVMMSVHFYEPWEFCGEESGQSTQWGAPANDKYKVPSWGDETNMRNKLNSCYTKFVKEGYPVVIGEYGSIDKNSMDPNNGKCREYFAQTLCTYAKQWGMIPVYWDNGYNGVYGFGLFDRNKCTVTQQGIIDAIMSVYPESAVAEPTRAPSPTPTITPSIVPSTEPSPIVEPTPTIKASGNPVPIVSPTPSETVPSKAPEKGITYDYKVTNNWGSGYIAEIVVTNKSGKTINNWTLSFDCNEKVTNLWGADFVGQTSKTVTVKCPSWATSFAPDASFTLGFIVEGTDTSAPTGYIMK